MNSATDSTARATYSGLAIALGVLVAGLALVLMGVQPILVGFYTDHLHLDLSQNGWVLAGEQFGGAAGALLGYWIATRIRWSYSIIGSCALAALANIATAYIRGFDALLLARFISGLASTAAYTVAIYFLGQTAKPERVFGALMVLQTSFFSIDAMILPPLNDRFGYGIAVGSASFWFFAALIAAFWLPAGIDAMNRPATLHQRQAGARPLVGAAALLGAFLLQLSIFSVWGFLERIGRGDGLSEEQIGYAIGIGVLGGIPGGLLPAVIGERFGRLSMIVLSGVLLVASYVALSGMLHMTGYLLWIGIMNVGWVLGLAYYMGLTVRHDPDGRMTRLIPFSQILSAGVGPACSALAIGDQRLAPIFVIGCTAATLGVVLVVATSAATARSLGRQKPGEKFG